MRRKLDDLLDRPFHLEEQPNSDAATSRRRELPSGFSERSVVCPVLLRLGNHPARVVVHRGLSLFPLVRSLLNRRRNSP